MPLGALIIILYAQLKLFVLGRLCKTTNRFISYGLLVLLILTACSENTGHDNAQSKAELDGLKVPEGFSIERIVDPSLLSFPMFVSFDGTGRMFVFESDGRTPTTADMLANPSYHVRLLQDTDADGIYDKSTIFADSLTIPKGGVFYRGSLYVTASPDFLRITDTDNDGVGDKKEVILTGWKLDHNAAILGGPFLGPDGWMYLTDARRGYEITTREGKKLKGKGARIWRCRPDGTGLEAIAGGGYDNAIELVFMPGGETIGTMTYFTDPQGGERDALMHWVEGGVYPKPHAVIAEDKLKLTGELMPVMKKIARVAPSGLMKYRGNAWGEEFNGNVFSAEFNTGRIIRSVITADGATFKTVDTPFITATAPDVHPTDVLQDADGSLIVINTGGWFIAGCPLSRVAKLDVPGGIYRVKKNNAERMEDPWGKKIEFKNKRSDELATLVMDSRVYVSQNAVEQLVQGGEQSIQAIKTSLLTNANENVRAEGVFILGRIGASARADVLRAMDDSSGVVQTAAARVAGLAKDSSAVPRLKALVLSKKLAVRRQAAIALEQIGDTSAVASLLQAISATNDRYAEHAITHALISLKSSSPLVNALHHPSLQVRKASLIALDQMDGFVLQSQHVVPFLQSNDLTLRNTGNWVATHHKDWGRVIAEHVQKGNHDKQLLFGFSSDPAVQRLIAGQLGNASTPPETKDLLFEVVKTANVKNFPAVWIGVFQNLLRTGDERMKLQVLSVIHTRALKQTNVEVQKILLDPNASAALRLKAYEARISYDPLLTAREFGGLLPYLDLEKSHEAPVRQQAARVLTTAELSSTQLSALAQKIPAVDVYVMPAVVHAFAGGMNEKVGQAFIASLTDHAERLNNISEDDLRNMLKTYPASVRKSAAPLFDVIRKKNAARLSELQTVQSSLKNGDVGAGRKLFFGKGTCGSCHAIANEGNMFAPDLTNIGEIRSRHDILEAIMFPSASFAREHETNKIVTKTSTYTGIIREQFADAIVIATGPGASVRVQRSDIVSVEPESFSLMPAGLEKQLNQQELSDLMAYLVSLPDGASGTIGY